MDKKKVRNAVLCGLAAVVLAGGAYLYATRAVPTGTGLEMEDNATVGIMPGVDLDQRKEELQKQLDEGQIAFSINTSPEFQGREGNLMLENPANNAKLIVAELVLDGTDTPVYRSKAIKPGTYLEKVTLDRDLPAGTYDATVYFNAYSEDTQKFIGKTGAAVKLMVDA